MLLERQLYKKLEWYFYKYDELSCMLRETEADIIDSKPNIEAGVNIRSGFHSDPTAAKAIKLCFENREETKRWLHIIDLVLKKYKGTELYALIQLKYFQDIKMIEVLEIMHVEKSTAYRWRDEVIAYAAMLALQERLISL